MVAPNGARRTRADHPALPVTHAQIVEATVAAHHAGAQVAHVHVRDEAGTHVLDADRYRRLVDAVGEQAPDLLVQVTTEAVGRYTPGEQRALVRELRPRAVSIAYQELFSVAGSDELARNRDFLAWAEVKGIAIQWILYAPGQLDQLALHISAGVAPPPKALLFVLGRYSEGEQSDPQDLVGFVSAHQSNPLLSDVPWSVCAFGQAETDCLGAALLLGGDVRVGFENSLWHADGTMAANNADRVAAIASLARAMGRRAASPAEARTRLGLPTI
ncbi:MAG: 3-keto-5-aminohexanoate cleavage protein [Devosiaceae bacterium]|nr:3-keto-5-aminohexanoate cleavage protein [Devosiaceae bacterium MH13]